MSVIKKRVRGCESLIATLGVEAQVVTITLDCLLAKGRPVDEVVIVYTENLGVRRVMDIIAGKFAGQYYPDIK